MPRKQQNLVVRISKGIVLLCLAVISFVSTFYAISSLCSFLSAPRKPFPERQIALGTILQPLCLDTLLVILFIFSHTYLRSAWFKSFLAKLGLDVGHRCFYNTCTALTISTLVRYWTPATGLVLWQHDLDSHLALWWPYAIIHVVAWLFIYAGCLIMDMPELLGVKQVFYEIQGLHQPEIYKSSELNRFYARMRHPSYLAFGAILWTSNVMSVDRLVLAVLWTLYMWTAWNPGWEDYAYQKRQFERKKEEILIQKNYY